MLLTLVKSHLIFQEGFEIQRSTSHPSLGCSCWYNVRDLPFVRAWLSKLANSSLNQ